MKKLWLWIVVTLPLLGIAAYFGLTGGRWGHGQKWVHLPFQPGDPAGKLVVRSFAVSLDGFSAAPGQSQQAPFGKDGLRLMGWAFATKHFSAMFGRGGGAEGIESALKQAFAAANGKDVRLGGGPATVRQYLKAGLIDEMHLVQVPVLFAARASGSLKTWAAWKTAMNASNSRLRRRCPTSASQEKPGKGPAARDVPGHRRGVITSAHGKHSSPRRLERSRASHGPCRPAAREVGSRAAPRDPDVDALRPEHDLHVLAS
jgi:hypothetical protein